MLRNRRPRVPFLPVPVRGRRGIARPRAVYDIVRGGKQVQQISEIILHLPRARFMDHDITVGELIDEVDEILVDPTPVEAPFVRVPNYAIEVRSQRGFTVVESLLTWDVFANKVSEFIARSF